jgi:hypothetical protein
MHTPHLTNQQSHFISFIKTKTGRPKSDILQEIETNAEESGKEFDACLIDLAQSVRDLPTQKDQGEVRWPGE